MDVNPFNQPTIFDKFEAFLRNIRELKERTITEYLFVIRRLYRLRNGDLLAPLPSYEEVCSLLIKLAEIREWKRNTKFRAGVGTMWFFKFAHWHKVIGENPFPQNPFRHERAPEPEIFTAREMDRLALNPFLSVRDILLLFVLKDTGIRRRELISLEIKDLNLDKRTLHIRAEVGKCEKWRYVSFSRQTKRIFRYYLRMLSVQSYRGPWLFPSIRYEKMSDSSISKTLRRRGLKLGIDAKPKKYRHTAGTRLVKTVGDIQAMKMLGHESLSMTARYTHLNQKDAKEIYDKAHGDGKP